MSTQYCAESCAWPPSACCSSQSASKPLVRLPFKQLRRGAGTASVGGQECVVLDCAVGTEMLKGGCPSPHTSQRYELPHYVVMEWAAARDVAARINVYVQAFRDGGGAAEYLQSSSFEHSRFDLSWLASSRERIVMQMDDVRRVLPLRQVRARLLLTDQAVYLHSHESWIPTPVLRLRLSELLRCRQRRWLPSQSALELQGKDGATWLVTFADSKGSHAAEFCRQLVRQPLVRTLRANALDVMVSRWVHGEVSSLDYLMYLNVAAGRSASDLSHYPVLPWVLADYSSQRIDIDEPGVYRDLSKPVGALNPERLRKLRERMADSGEDYLYGTHYSTPSYVMYFLLRQHPEWMLMVHGGRFDHGSRLFDSVESCWRCVMTQSGDYKELIPEFYVGDGGFLKGPAGVDFGVKHTGERVRQDVLLPPWAEGDAAVFVRTLRRALEGAFVSSRLHLWIDLIFGCRSRGEAALEADNMFHPVTYGDIGGTAPEAAEVQMREFGQCPAQLFAAAHPRRLCPSTPPRLIDFGAVLPVDSDLIEEVPESPLTPLDRMPSKVSTAAAPTDDDGSPAHASFCAAVLAGAEAEATVAVVDITSMIRLGSPERRPTSSGSPTASPSSPRNGVTGVPSLQVLPQELRLAKHRAVCLTAVGFRATQAPAWVERGRQQRGCCEERDCVVTFAGCESGRFTAVDALTGTALRDVPLGGGCVRALVPAGDNLVVGSARGGLYLWSVSSARLLDRVLSVHDDCVTTVVAAPDGRAVLSGSDDATAKLWALTPSCVERSPLLEIDQGLDRIALAAWHGDGQRFCTLGDKRASLYDVRAGEAAVVEIDVEGGCGICFASGEHVAVLADSSLREFDLRRADRRHRQITGLDGATCLCATPSDPCAWGAPGDAFAWVGGADGLTSVDLRKRTVHPVGGHSAFPASALAAVGGEVPAVVALGSDGCEGALFTVSMFEC
eukprot:TRINITY_DN2303_c0_g1_i2.p1 TRINITY_DN2303_c0_g1~~TRINITY_DN2303_c0_g1_i2.p1  ORF type:complete len:954 (+),score=267.23 TRINITY_DN2303_c0_g1_i2:268-3129(+)